MRHHITFTSGDCSNLKSAAIPSKPLNITFIKRQAKILKELGNGKFSNRDYYTELLEFKNNPLKFDKEFEKRRREIFDAF